MEGGWALLHGIDVCDWPRFLREKWTREVLRRWDDGFEKEIKEFNTMRIHDGNLETTTRRQEFGDESLISAMPRHYECCGEYMNRGVSAPSSRGQRGEEGPLSRFSSHLNHLDAYRVILYHRINHSSC